LAAQRTARSEEQSKPVENVESARLWRTQNAPTNKPHAREPSGQHHELPQAPNPIQPLSRDSEGDGCWGHDNPRTPRVSGIRRARTVGAARTFNAHLLFAGYLFTAAVIGLDPAPHRPSRVVTAVVLVLAMASHSILAKYLYANPPGAVPMAQAQDGAQLMYYAGAWIEAAIIVIFCAQWYRAAGRRVVTCYSSGQFST
jgi:hypothetical protein